jgi:hypothetical protein
MNTMTRLMAAAACALAAGNAQADLGESLAAGRQHYGQPVKIEKRDLANYVTEYYVSVNKDGNAFGLQVVQTYYCEKAVMVAFYLDRPFTDEWINFLDQHNIEKETEWVVAREGIWFSKDRQFILMCTDYPDGASLRTYGLVELAGPLIRHDHPSGDTK